MSRALTIVVGWFLLGASAALAQDWTANLFTQREHDFGSVARASKAEYEFQITNHSKSELHIAGVRTSCGCTTPKITKETLAPGETGSILAIFNTRTHLGQRAATITVSFDKPQYREVQLRIKGYVRQDIVIDPGVVKFGTINAGEAAEQKVSIEYAGRSDWKILEVVSPDNHLQVELHEKQRGGGRAGYELAVKLKPEATTGYYNQELILVTNDHREKSQRIPLLVEGRVVSGVSISPASLYLGDMEMGQQITRQFVVRARQPFKIKHVSAEDVKGELSFQADEEAKTLHVITLTFTPNQPGKLEQRICVATDLDGQPDASCLAVANVAERSDED